MLSLEARLQESRALLQSTIGRISGGEDLSMDEMSDAIGLIMQGKCADTEIALLLTALRAKGESVEEIAGAAKCMRAHMTQIHSTRENLLDTCGTGGDGSGTFNVSTAAALVAAAAGASVAKHGNRGVTSKSGSADVLASLGVNVEATVEQVERCLDEVGICFCFAPLLHQSMKNVAKVRRELGVPTIFNLLGPLCNPASAPYQLLGVGRPELRTKLAEALRLLGTRRAVVVSGADGLDEVTIATTTNVSESAEGKIREFRWSPEEFGVDSRSLQSLKVDGPQASAKMIREVLDGTAGGPRDIVVLNAAAALWTVGLEQDLIACAGRAAEAIDNGSAKRLLEKLAKVSAA